MLQRYEFLTRKAVARHKNLVEAEISPFYSFFFPIECTTFQFHVYSWCCVSTESWNTSPSACHRLCAHKQCSKIKKRKGKT